MNCRCGHGRGTHSMVRGRKHLPCHATIRVERPGFTFQGGPVMGLVTVAPRMATDLCRCRDYVLPGGKTTWGQKAGVQW